MTGERARLGEPDDRTFATKIALDWQMIGRALSTGLPFECVVRDDNYGKSNRLYGSLNAARMVDWVWQVYANADANAGCAPPYKLIW